ncbi:FMN-binding negative transcriptional regulator [Saccharopolyspora sp. NPDC050389]|uniref:FMN-binding negative transcriptional regulator n=1 Tax=Saccharopolyspora sp. NPDC050389 TaxID=3155516 RepID=UPI00340B5D4C
MVVPSDSAPTELVGTTLFGHLARVNPHWTSFGDGREVLLIFAGPHGYVSPTVYGYEPAVPTWNYAAVHLTGTVEVTDDAADTLHIVSETVRGLEGLRQPEWDMTASLETFAGLVEHVVAFRIRVTSAKSNFKLSQDMPADVRDAGPPRLPRHRQPGPRRPHGAGGSVAAGMPAAPWCRVFRSGPGKAPPGRRTSARSSRGWRSAPPRASCRAERPRHLDRLFYAHICIYLLGEASLRWKDRDCPRSSHHWRDSWLRRRRPTPGRRPPGHAPCSHWS